MIFLQAQSNGRSAFLVLNAACSRDITDLELTVLNQQFDNASIEAGVGVNSDSITMFSRHLNGINAQRPENQRKNANDLTLRLLHSINGMLCPQLALDAVKEIRATADKRKFQDTITGMRDFSAAVQDFDEIWRTLFSQGLITPAARRHPGGVRVSDV